MTISRRLVLLLGLPIAAVLAITAALLVIGGPSKARLERMDERRTSDLSTLASAIERHQLFTGNLPASLTELRERLETRGSANRPPETDPETGVPYSYKRLGDTHFRICTDLALPDAASPPMQPRIAGFPENPDRSMEIVPQLEGNRFCLEGILHPN